MFYKLTFVFNQWNIFQVTYRQYKRNVWSEIMRVSFSLPELYTQTAGGPRTRVERPLRIYHLPRGTGALWEPPPPLTCTCPARCSSDLFSWLELCQNTCSVPICDLFSQCFIILYAKLSTSVPWVLLPYWCPP